MKEKTSFLTSNASNELQQTFRFSFRRRSDGYTPGFTEVFFSVSLLHGTDRMDGLVMITTWGKSHKDREQYKRIYTMIEELACLLPRRYGLDCYALITLRRRFPNL